VNTFISKPSTAVQSINGKDASIEIMRTPLRG